MSVGVVIATFGDRLFWSEMAKRAKDSVLAQTVLPEHISRVHGENLHESRNAGVRATNTSHVIILDADDELAPNYIEELLKHDTGADVLIPAVQIYRVNGKLGDDAFVIRKGASLANRNHLPIGAMFTREAFDAVGGFEDMPIYEDWMFWSRIWIAGFRNFLTVESAVYRVHSRAGSRNCQTQHALEATRRIREVFAAAGELNVKDKRNRSFIATS